MPGKQNRISKGILGLILAVGIGVGSASNASAAFFSGGQELEVTNDGLALPDDLRYDNRGKRVFIQSLETPLNAIGTPISPWMGTLLRMADEFDLLPQIPKLDQGPT